jgi:hypothetical protein
MDKSKITPTILKFTIDDAKNEEKGGMNIEIVKGENKEEYYKPGKKRKLDV